MLIPRLLGSPPQRPEPSPVDDGRAARGDQGGDPGGDPGGVAAADAIRMISLSRWPASDPALLITVGAARGNPVTELLGSGLAAAGICGVDVPDLAAARTVAARVLAATDGRARIGVHLNWLHPLVAATTGAGADRAADAVENDLAGLHEAGVAVLWTVHNVFPHDAPYPEVQLRVRRVVAAAADLVHVLDPHTPALTGELFTLRRAAVRHVPHPGWQGVYPDHVSRERARARLGLPADDVVLLLFGRLTADKGVADLVEAFTSPQAPPGTRLLLAGSPGRDPDRRTAAALAVAARHPQVDLWPVRVADVDIQLFLRAADIAVTPHRRPLNSGVQALALTYGLPLVTAVGTSPDTAPAVSNALGNAVTHTVTFPAGDVAGLRTALAAAGPLLLTPAARASARAAAAAIHPDRVAPAFTALVAELLRLRPGATGPTDPTGKTARITAATAFPAALATSTADPAGSRA